MLLDDKDEDEDEDDAEDVDASGSYACPSEAAMARLMSSSSLVDDPVEAFDAAAAPDVELAPFLGFANSGNLPPLAASPGLPSQVATGERLSKVMFDPM